MAAALTTQPSAPLSDLSHLKTTYILYYRKGNNPHPQFLAFDYESRDMKKVSERAKRHCEVQGYRFVYVQPLYVDLDKADNVLTNSDL